MTRPPPEHTYYDFFKAKYTTQYLESYIDHHKYASQALREKIRFGFEVEDISKKDLIWTISGKDKKSEAKVVISATKVIVASGLASTPLLPNLPFKERFQGPIIHQKKFWAIVDTLLSRHTARYRTWWRKVCGRHGIHIGKSWKVCHLGYPHAWIRPWLLSPSQGQRPI